MLAYYYVMDTTKFGDCPQCQGAMRVETLSCWRCGTTVTGQLAIPLLARLPREQSDFVIRFLTANGSLTGVQETMHCSYPKVRRLLNQTMEVLREELDRVVQEKEEILASLEESRLDGPLAAQLLRNLVRIEDESTD